MASWLTNLRKKPKHVRDNIAFGLSGGFTALICAVWFFGGAGTSSLAESAGEGSHFFQTFLGQFGKQVASLKESLPEQKEAPKATSSTAQSFPESGPAVASSSLTTSSASSTGAPAPRQIMIVTTSSTKATTSTPAQ